jgi:peptidyl-prolyl cis-trans isomerase SurA
MPNAFRPFLPFLLALTLLTPLPAAAQRVAPARPATSTLRIEEGIAAVVNDGVITKGDVNARIALGLLSANLPDTAEVRQHLAPQALRALVDEQLQMQEGKKMGLTVTDAEVKNAAAKVSADNNIPGGDILAFIKAHGVPPSALVTQIKASLMWSKVAARVLRPRVDIGDDEVEAIVQRMRDNAGKQEYLVSEIFLPVDQPKDDDQTRAFAEKLLSEIKRGANFGAVARQFSKGVGAPSGGDIGWVQAGQMPTEIDHVLQTLEKGELAGPVRAADGYHILGVRDRRTIAQGDLKEATAKLQQAFHPFLPDQDKEMLLKEADRLRQAVTSCDGLAQRLAMNFPNWQWQDLGEVRLSAVQPWLAEKVRDVPIGHSSEAMATDQGALIVFVCDRKAPETIDRQAIRNSIGAERMDLLARRMMRDLRRNATIDIRL